MTNQPCPCKCGNYYADGRPVEPELISIDVTPGSVVITPDQLKEIEGVLYDIPFIHMAALLTILSECEQVGK